MSLELYNVLKFSIKKVKIMAYWQGLNTYLTTRAAGVWSTGLVSTVGAGVAVVGAAGFVSSLISFLSLPSAELK
jgi:hypothetical protein